MKLWGMTLSLTLVVAMASRAQAQTYGPPGQTLPAGAQETELVEIERPRPWLAVTGMIVGGGSYGVSLGVGVIYLALVFPIQASFGCDDPADVPMQLMLPIFGPIIAAGDDSLDDERDLRTTMYVNAGLQIGGAAMIAAAFLFKEKVMVRRPVDRRRRAERELERPSWVLGSGPRGSYGLSVSGIF